MADQTTSTFKFLELPYEIRAIIYQYCVAHNDRVPFYQGVVREYETYHLPLALRWQPEYKGCLAITRVSKQVRSEATEELLPHFMPFLQAKRYIPKYRELGLFPEGLFSKVRCLEFLVIDSIMEARWVLNALPATVQHFKFHFDWRHPYYLRGYNMNYAPWVAGLADLIIQKLHPDYKNTGADLYLERYWKETSQDDQYRDFGGSSGPMIFSEAEDWAIDRATRRTLPIPEQLKALTVVAASVHPELDFTLDVQPELAWDLISIERDRLKLSPRTTKILLRHKQLVVPLDADSASLASLRQTEVKEKVVEHAESVFRHYRWNGLANDHHLFQVVDRRPTYRDCHEQEGEQLRSPYDA